MVLAIRSARLDLVQLDPATLRLVAARDDSAVERLLGARVDPEWAPTVPAKYRLDQLALDPSEQPWLVRALILRSAGAVAGHIGFHARPDDRGRVEVGYTIVPEFRRQGLAREAVHALTQWASGTGAARTCVASVSPANAPSLGLVRSLGFVQVGEQEDEEDGLELVFERALPLAR